VTLFRGGIEERFVSAESEILFERSREAKASFLFGLRVCCDDLAGMLPKP